jgi:hypothetical protein
MRLKLNSLCMLRDFPIWPRTASVGKARRSTRIRLAIVPGRCDVVVN